MTEFPLLFWYQLTVIWFLIKWSMILGCPICCCYFIKEGQKEESDKEKSLLQKEGD
jgi:hypothetical protein